ncbi:MAG: PHP domain-containing protein [Lachnospiraceae bacterium]|nr:PHP domain-containing protein [Lachnospiraceae bacterium]
MTGEGRIVDLHVHSNHSDGTFTPSELISYAVEKKLSVMALTDHDTVDGLKEIREAAEKTENSPEIVPGIELSTDRDGKDIHIVGLFINERDEAFLSWLKKFQDSRDLRNETMCERLRTGAGMDISFEALKREFPGAVITRAHYAKYMLIHGITHSLKEGFDRYVGDHSPFFVPREKVSPEEGIKLILSAGGIPVLAHPFQYAFGRERLERFVAELKEAGLIAIEAYYTTHSPSDTREILELAERYGLFISGGSDFHGNNKVGVDLAVGKGDLRVSYDIYERLREYHEKAPVSGS